METMTCSWQDREEIRELYARYSIALDHGDFTGWIDCFAEDAVFDSPRFGHYAGREALRKFVDVYRDSLGGSKSTHINGNLSFQVEGERATGICYFTYYHCKDGRATLAALGHYRDRLRREGGRWKFERREVFLDARPAAALMR
jgi:3-phenylpropionate/cinnamic acid dioxygenase small subunit